MILIFLSLLTLIPVFGNDGYPVDAVKIQYDKVKRAFIKNNTCFPVTVSVNDKEYLVNPGAEELLNSNRWGAWFWSAGSIGRMDEKRVPLPVKSKSEPDYGPNTGVHTGSLIYSYDFSVEEGTYVYAVEEGVVARIVQHYREAHQDKNRMEEVNRVMIVHPDGTAAEYVHLKAGSVNLKLCEKVILGQIVGMSGHNGYSSGPHLHLDVRRPIGEGKFQSISLRFLTK
jgi:murein DD-endopeptidase MepM/ murein hydrolase activator NlpD